MNTITINGGFLYMADLGKNGYQWTGYTEPFITPEAISSGAALAKAGGYDTMTINGAVPIEYTEFRNAGLYTRVLAVNSGTEFTTKDINFDTRMDTAFSYIGRFVITDGTTTAVVSDVTYDDVNDWYVVTTATSLTLVASQGCKVVGRIVDVGAVTASQDYNIGDNVHEPYPFET